MWDGSAGRRGERGTGQKVRQGVFSATVCGTGRAAATRTKCQLDRAIMQQADQCIAVGLGPRTGSTTAHDEHYFGLEPKAPLVPKISSLLGICADYAHTTQHDIMQTAHEELNLAVEQDTNKQACFTTSNDSHAAWVANMCAAYSISRFPIDLSWTRSRKSL